MTLIVKGHDTGPIPANYLESAPVGSWVAFRYVPELVPTIYRKQPDGLWVRTSDLAERPNPRPVGPQNIALGWESCPYWSLHHPGLIRVVGRLAGPGWSHQFEWRWTCAVCDDRSFGAYVYSDDAHKAARAHVANL